MTYKKDIGDDVEGQAFPRGVRVLVTGYDNGETFEAIVDFSYGQRFGGDDTTVYSLLTLNAKGDVAVGFTWRYERDLSLLCDCVEAGKQLIDEYYDI